MNRSIVELFLIPMNKRDKRLSSYHCAEYSSVTCVQQFVLSERIERLSRYLANFANVFIRLDSVAKHVFSGDNVFVVYCPISNLKNVKTVWQVYLWSHFCVDESFQRQGDIFHVLSIVSCSSNAVRALLPETLKEVV